MSGRYVRIWYVATVTGPMSFVSPVYSFTSSSVSVDLSMISRRHCFTAVMLVVITSVDFCSKHIAATPTIVLPLPHGRTITPDPPRTSPPA